MNVGDCLRVTFQNLLSPSRRDDEQSATRWASIHAVGMNWTTSSLDDGTYVGANPNGLAGVGQTVVYTTYAAREGEHVLNSAGALAGGEGDGGQANSGLFGALIVEPAGARWYRSQVTRQDLDYTATGMSMYNQPVINYEAVYPAGHPRAGLPILNMLSGTEIVHTDLTAVITGSAPSSTAGPGSSGWFPAGTFPNNPQYPQREQPFREFVFLYHDEVGAVQAFPEFEQPQLEFTLHSGRDAFAINYGSGGIGAEVLANRLRVGPCGTAPSACTRSSFSAPGRWATPPWWWTCRPTCRAASRPAARTPWGRTRTSRSTSTSSRTALRARRSPTPRPPRLSFPTIRRTSTTDI